MDEFLQTYNSPKFTQEEIVNLNRPASINSTEIKTMINNFPKQKVADP